MDELIIETIAIGDELLTGRISDTNSTFVSRELFGAGFRVTRQTVIGDEDSAMRSQFEQCAERCHIAICFGGLGPTSDDKTVDTVASLIDSKVEIEPQAKAKLVTYYQSRNRAITERALRQVRYPTSCTSLDNPVGLAPGFSHKIGRCLFFFLPGVPSEMKAMFRNSVLPQIISEAGGAEVQSHIWRCLGIAESELQQLMDPVELQLSEDAWLGYRTSFPENHLTLYGKKKAWATLAEVEQSISETLKPYCYTQENKEIEQVVVEALQSRGTRLCVVESCTGGMVVQRLTRVPGSSQVVWGGVVSYQLEAKSSLLGVNIPDASQAVSAEASLQLARAAQKLSGCTIAAAVTGYMGPDAGTQSDPAGTAYLCVLGKQEIQERVQIASGRERVSSQWGISSFLLDLIRKSLS